METESLQYTIINHVARKKLGLTLLEYSIIDSIYNLSNNPRNNGYSTASKQYIADWLGCSKRSVINTIAKAINQGLVEKPAELRSAQDSRLRTTQKWYDNVIMNNTGEIISQTGENNSLAGEKNSPQNSKTGEKISPNKDNIYKDINNDIYIKDKNKHTNHTPQNSTGGNSKNKPKNTKEKNKKKYGECVMLTEKEYDKLKKTYGKNITDDCIEKLSAYKMAKGRKYKSDYGAIIQWVFKAVTGYDPADYRRKLEVERRKEQRMIEERMMYSYR